MAPATRARIRDAFPLSRFDATDGLPRARVDDRTLPLNEAERHYAGLGTWNSRGMDLVGAVRAMLGDSAAFVESADFTARRLQLRYGSGTTAYRAAWSSHFFGSTGAPNWGGHDSFTSEWAPAIDAHQELDRLLRLTEAKREFDANRILAALAAAAPQSDRAAAQLARILLDAAALSTWDDRKNMAEEVIENRDYAREQRYDA